MSLIGGISVGIFVRSPNITEFFCVRVRAQKIEKFTKDAFSKKKMLGGFIIFRRRNFRYVRRHKKMQGRSYREFIFYFFYF